MRASDGLASIGDVAERFQLRTSALRFYEEKGLVTPATRQNGRRLYGPASVRRVGLIRMWQQHGLLSLDDIGTLFVPAVPRTRWRGVLETRASVLDEELRVIRTACEYLRYFLTCTSDNPLKTCPYIRRDLDEMFGFQGEGPCIIGALARRYDVRTSTIRYYEDEKLMTSIRVRGRRHYGREELHRLGFIVLCRQFGHLSLDDVAVMLRDDVTHGAWQAVVRGRLAALEQRIARNTGAVRYLEHWLTCPGDDLIGVCPYLARALDDFLEASTPRG
ncbi:MerR family transcriptional regulator [Pendulispora albinea]|uniref:MerR family transcriptional regulator n=1 Tax=Pendulispora albinea TaxID=2741071 RepID=A0ABZ2MBY6_9BACT